MGSVSDSIVRHAHCPVLVVRKVRATLQAGEISDQLASSERSGTMPTGASGMPTSKRGAMRENHRLMETDVWSSPPLPVVRSDLLEGQISK